MLKLAALGALGYAGYKYFQKNNDRTDAASSADRQPAMAGGPISDRATVRNTPPQA